MLDINECEFIGNLTRDPQLNPTKNGSFVVNFGIACNRWYKKSNGESESEATFIELEAYDSGAQKIYDIFRKGDKIYVKTSAKNSTWVDSEGKKRNQVIFRINKFWLIAKPLVGDLDHE